MNEPAFETAVRTILPGKRRLVKQNAARKRPEGRGSGCREKLIFYPAGAVERTVKGKDGEKSPENHSVEKYFQIRKHKLKKDD